MARNMDEVREQVRRRREREQDWVCREESGRAREARSARRRRCCGTMLRRARTTAEDGQEQRERAAVHDGWWRCETLEDVEEQGRAKPRSDAAGPKTAAQPPQGGACAACGGVSWGGDWWLAKPTAAPSTRRPTCTSGRPGASWASAGRGTAPWPASTRIGPNPSRCAGR